jgi:hypothetical protein
MNVSKEAGRGGGPAQLLEHGTSRETESNHTVQIVRVPAFHVLDVLGDIRRKFENEFYRPGIVHD